MREIVSLLTPRYQQLPEAKPIEIVGIEGSINLLFPEYLVNKCFVILKETSDAKCWLQVKFRSLFRLSTCVHFTLTFFLKNMCCCNMHSDWLQLSPTASM
jgi:hypothetical protein